MGCEVSKARFRVGPPPPGLEDLADFVLAEFTPEERETLAGLLDPMAEAVECWLDEGIEKAMTKFNR
jgi:PTH1 family peptidyl-tRNA hydrolase